MNKVNVVKKGTYAQSNLPVFAIGRATSGAAPGETPLHALANPFTLRREEDREEIVAKFAHHLADALERKDRDICHALNVLFIAARKGDVTLVCFCKPRLCHGDVLAWVIRAALEGVEKERIIEGLQNGVPLGTRTF